MKHIVFFLGSVSGRGGIERVSIEIANRLSETQRFKVTIISLNDGEAHYIVSKNISIIKLYHCSRLFARALFPVAFKLRRLLKKIQADYIVDVDVILSLFSLCATWRTKTKVIAWEHFNFSENLNKLSRKIAKQLACRFAYAIVVLTKADLEAYRIHVKQGVRLSYIYNPLPRNFESVKPVTQHEKQCIAIGRLTYQKGFDILIDMWCEIHKKCPDWQLLIVGSGEEEASLKQKIQEYHLEQTILLKPFCKDIGTMYQKASLYLLPSRFEGFGMTLIEAKSYGLVNVAFDCHSGPGEIIKDNRDGYLVPYLDCEAFIEKTVYLMKNRAVREQMQKGALEDQQFFGREIIKHWENLF